MPPRAIDRGMQCHYCNREAAFAADKEGIRVGLCEEHFREQFQTLADSGVFNDLRKELNIDRT